MTTSGTYAFSPSLGEIVLYAFDLCGMRSASLLAEHMSSARMAANLLLSRWANAQINLWKVELVTQSLTAGVTTYPVDASVVAMLDVYVSQTSNSVTTDRIIMPVSRTEYASYPNKAMSAGFPSVFWFDRLISPSITIWPVPDGTGADTLNYYVCRQIQDAVIPGNETVEIPYRWLDAFANGLAYRLSRMWAPQMTQQLKAEADESFAIASNQDVENSNFYISPMVGGYFRT